jgi:hypothetical protein
MSCSRGICFGSWLLSTVPVILMGCAAGPQVTRVSEVSTSDDGPYKDVLVVSLFESFDMRRYLETELVSQLAEKGVEAVASTSMMDTRTPVDRQTFVEMVEKIGADAVLLTQPVALESSAKKTTRNPQSTYNIRPTYYYNVFSVELTEYVEPPGIRLEHDVTLLVELISVESREPVWAIQTRSNVVWKSELERDYSAYVDEAKTITREMARDEVIADSR